MDFSHERLEVHHNGITRVWEDVYSDWIRQICETCTVESFLDIGANTGAVVEFLCEKLKPQPAKIYAVEPVPQNFSRLSDKMRDLNSAYNNSKHIELFNKAVYYGSKKSNLLGLGDQNTGGLFLTEVKTFTAENSSHDVGIEIECITLEEAMPDVKRIDICKIDVEGSEWNIIENSTFIKEKVHHLLLECHWLSEQEVLQFLSKHLLNFEIKQTSGCNMWLKNSIL